MNKILILYGLNSLILCYPLFRQFMLIAKSDENDKYILTKVLFFIFNFCILVTNWLCYFKVREAAWFFFLVAILISFWTYKTKNK